MALTTYQRKWYVHPIIRRKTKTNQKGNSAFRYRSSVVIILNAREKLQRT